MILVGLLANTCVETTAKSAVDLGYHVTLVKDATAALGKEMMHPAHEINGPTFAHQIVTTKQLLATLDAEVNDEALEPAGTGRTL